MSDLRTYARALRGALAFLTRIPVSRTRGRKNQTSDWEAFRSQPATFPLVGWLVGTLTAIPLLAAGLLPDSSVAFGYLLSIYLVTGIHHLDGVADLGDALVVHGDVERRLAVLSDTTTGVGALLAVTGVIVGLALAALELAALPVTVAIGIVVASEVGAKTGLAAMACLGKAAHEGLGSAFTTRLSPAHLVVPVSLSLPAVLLTWPHPAAVAALLGALTATTLPWLWARGHLGGVTGDVFGAANELGRLAGLHAGVIVWTLW